MGYRATIVHLARLGLGVAAVLLAACGDDDAGDGAAWEWQLPPDFPSPRVPADNPMSAAKVELGRRLFYDPKLSGNGTQSCGSCHLPALAFTETLPVSLGSTGENTPRNAMALTNIVYAATLTWANPNLRRLEEQALIPMFGENPVELGTRRDELLAALAGDATYQSLFRAAYPGDAAAVTLDHVTGAIAAFERTLISGNSPYDRFVRGDGGALDDSQKRGLALFISETIECFHCHGGFNFSNSVDHDGNQFDQAAFHNNALYNVDGRGAYPANNTGVHAISSNPNDMGKFKAPTLRNIELTAPYMHDGSIATLEEVIDHYARGGRNVAAGPHVGDGRDNPYKSEFVSGFEITAEQKADLVAFLRALTDLEFVTNPAHGDPFRE